jgi:hypothetical protein
VSTGTRIIRSIQLDVRRRRQVGEQVVDRDGLGFDPDPARRDHDRQPLDERAHHLEGQAARADHDRRTELQHRNSGRAQQRADLVPAAQVRREVLPVAETAEVDDAPNSRPSGGGREILRRLAITLLEVTLRAHRVDEVVGRVDAR